MHRNLIIICMILILSSLCYGKGEDINNSLIAYFPLDGYTTSNDTHTYDASWKTTSGTLETSAKCKLGTCYSFSKAGVNYLLTGNYAMGANPDFTECGWFKFNQSGLTLGMLAHENYNYALGKSNTDIYKARSFSGGQQVLSCSNNHTNVNTWYFVCLVASGGNAFVYQNGTLECSGALPTALGTSPLGIGEAYTAGDGLYTMQGFVDEVGFWARNLSQENITYLYNNGLGCAYPFTNCGADNLNFVRLTQNPPDINSLNVIVNPLQVSYNITSDVTGVINSSVGFWHKTNSTHTDSDFFLNGSVYRKGWNLENNFTNQTSNFTFSQDESDVYPASYNVHQDEIATLTHTQNTLSSSSVAWLPIINVTNATNGFLEVMINSSSGVIPSKVYYCNSSYASGNPAIASDCILIDTITPTASFNHNHSANSRHQLFPFSISGNKIGSVGVTSNSTFLIVIGGATWSVWDVAKSSKDWRKSSNNGNSYTIQSGRTMDAHIHQYDLTETYYYMATACNSVICSNSTMQSDRINYADLPPTSPIVLRPNSTDVFNTAVNITYSNGTANIPNVLLNSSVDLLNGSFNFVVNVMKNTTNLTKIFNSASIATGQYIIRVQNCDNASLCSYGYSDYFWIDNTNPYISAITPANGTSVYNSGTMNVTALLQDSRDLYNVQLNITNTTGETFFYEENLISGTSYNYGKGFSIKPAINESVYNGNIRICDSHTDRIISPALDIVKGENFITFNLKDADITIESKAESYSTEAKKELDRYSFTFKYIEGSKISTKVYLLTSNKHIEYLPKSKYKGHFVVGSEYWVDFEQEGDVSVNEILENVFEVTITNSRDVIEFKSIGELNCFSEDFYFVITGIAPASTGLYSNDILKDTNWFNQDATDTSTIAGVLILFFLFFVWIVFVALTEWSKIPIIGLMASIYGFILSWLYFTTISAVMGVAFAMINLVYIVRSVMLTMK